MDPLGRTSLLSLPNLQDVLHQLFLVMKGVLEAEEDAADNADDDHHADDYERGRHNQDQESQIIISKKTLILRAGSTKKIRDYLGVFPK